MLSEQEINRKHEELNGLKVKVKESYELIKKKQDMIDEKVIKPLNYDRYIDYIDSKLRDMSTQLSKITLEKSKDQYVDWQNGKF